MAGFEVTIEAIVCQGLRRTRHSGMHPVRTQLKMTSDRADDMQRKGGVVALDHGNTRSDILRNGE
jgi:hypothetical protein